MNLKPFVASMFILGLASSSAVAAPYYYNADTQAQLDGMKSKIAKMEAIINPNQAGGFQQRQDWFNRISVSGQANIDASWANLSPVNFGVGPDFVQRQQSATDLSVRNASLFIDADVNYWTKAHVGLLYQDTNNFARLLGAGTTIPTSQFDAQLANNNFNSVLDEAFVRFGNFDRTPIYFQIGKQYLPFGNYKRFPIVAPFTQLLTQTRATSANIGWVDASGFNATAYIFRGNPRIGDTTTVAGVPGVPTTSRVQNFGVNLGFANTGDRMGYNISVGYLRNMADVKFISDRLGAGGVPRNAYTDSVGALSVDGALASGPFDVNGHFVTALKQFNIADLQYVNNGVVTAAKPLAWGLEAGYSFKVMNHESRLALGYQRTKRTSGDFTAGINAASIPKQRIIADYAVNVSRNADIGVAVYNDRDHSTASGSTGNNATVGVLRVAVKFS